MDLQPELEGKSRKSSRKSSHNHKSEGAHQEFFDLGAMDLALEAQIGGDMQQEYGQEVHPGEYDKTDPDHHEGEFDDDPEEADEEQK